MPTKKFEDFKGIFLKDISSIKIFHSLNIPVTACECLNNIERKFISNKYL